MRNFSGTVMRLALPASILMAAITVATQFRYEMHVQGRHVIVQDRWAGVAELCVPAGTGFSKCYPFLDAGMADISKPSESPNKAAKGLSDEEFQELLGKVSPPPSGQ